MVVPSRLRAGDAIRVGTLGLRSRRGRTILSALGIGIGIASIVGVLGITRSSQAQLVAQIDRLGTNLLTVENGRSIGGAAAELPAASTGMIGRIGPVEHVAGTALLPQNVYRSDRIPSISTAGLAVRAVDPGLLDALSGSVLSGTFLNRATAHFPAVVLGAEAAQTLGIPRIDRPARIWLGGRWFQVVCIISPLQLAPEIDRSALIGFPIAAQDFGFDGSPTRIYVAADPDQVPAVRAVLGATADPAHPDQVNVARPSDALAARVAVVGASTRLFVALGAVALLVGGVGIANVMVIAVLERRSEIGLRRALGAARMHVAAQFIIESLLLSALGGFAGILAGTAITAGFAVSRGWPVDIPPAAIVGSLVAAAVIGAIAGVYPAMRASKLSPTEALRGP